MLSKKLFTEIIGGNLRKVRTKKGIAQDELSEMCKFYRTYINLIEKA